MKNRLFLMLVICILWISLSLMPLSAAFEEKESAFPFDLAFTQKSFPYADRPVLSSDGRFLVYAIFTPRSKSAGSELEAEPRYLPNGTPASALGSKLYISEVSTGKTNPLIVGEANTWRPVFSPDDKSVAFYSDIKGLPQLWIYDVKSGKVRNVSPAKIKGKLWPGDEAFWSPAGKEVFVPVDLEAAGRPIEKPLAPITPSKNEPSVSVYQSGKELKTVPGETKPPATMEYFIKENNATLAAIDIATGAIRVVVPATSDPLPSVLRLSPSGQWISYLSVFRMKELNSASTLIDLGVAPSSGGPIQFLAKDLLMGENDYFGLTYAWRPGKDQMVYHQDKKLWIVDFENGKKPEPRQLAAELGELTFSPIHFTSDGNSILAGFKPVDDHDYSDPRPTALALINLDGSKTQVIDLDAKLKFKEALASNPRILWQQQKQDCTVLMENSESGEHTLIRLNFENGKNRTLWNGLALFEFYGSSRDQRSIVGVYQDVQTPPDLYLFDSEFASKKSLSHIEPRFDKIQVGPAKIFETSIPSYDGQLIKARTAILLPPGGKIGDKLPTIVFQYGGSRLSRSADRFGGGSPNTIPALLFTSRGYAVLYPDLVIGPEGEGRNPVQDLVDMILPQVYRATELGYSDINRVAITGQSYGGYGTASIISGTNLFRAAVAISGLYDLPGLYSWMDKTNTGFSRNWSEKGQGRMGTHPWADLKRYVDNSPYYRADKINTPLLMLHGANDDTCPVVDAKKMFNALERLGKTAQLAVYKGEGHVVWDWSKANAVDAYQRVLDFFDKYLSGQKSEPKEKE